MNVEDRLIDALAEFDQVEPAPDLFARVEASVRQDRLHRHRVRRSVVAGLVATMVVVALLWVATDHAEATVSGWAVFVAQLMILTTAVVVLGRIIPRFGQAYLSDVFRLDARTATNFLRLHNVAFHLAFGGYVIILSWHREMGGDSRHRRSDPLPSGPHCRIVPADGVAACRHPDGLAGHRSRPRDDRS